MKQYILIILITVLAFTLLGTFAKAQPAYTPHEDPEHVESLIPTFTYIQLYADAMQLMMTGEHKNATDLMEEFKEYILPDELNATADQYQDLLSTLSSMLSELDLVLEDAEFLLEEKQLQEVRNRLTYADELILEIENLIIDIEDATDSLVRMLGKYAETALAEQELEKAQSRIGDLLEHLRELNQEKLRLLKELNVALEAEQIQLKETKISIDIDTTTAYVGDTIFIWGVLTTETVPMSGRELEVVIGGNTIDTVTSELDGTYSSEVNVPFEYNTPAVLYMKFNPVQDDADVYQGCSSNEIALDVLFFKTALDFTAPSEFYACSPITIFGDIESPYLPDTEMRTVAISLDGKLITEIETHDHFELTLITDPTITEGIHSISAKVMPMELYNGAQEGQDISVIKSVPQIEIDAPEIALSARSIEITGRVASHELGPARNAEVQVSLYPSSTTVFTDSNGQFHITLDMPLSLRAVGPQDLTVAASPIEPWFRKTQESTDTFVVSPIVAGLIIIAFVSVGLVLFRGQSENKEISTSVESAASLQTGNGTIVAPSPIQESSIITNYRHMLRLLVKSTGITLKPHMTLRDYIRQVIANQSALQIVPFLQELTLLVEKELYSPRSLSPKETLRAEELFHILEEELRH
ncbi:MAG: DUF4129 domain-containing protein [Chloroflexota bacterium]|nr:DUF4129 domain-containing protein [Chloroflexota bacterium]